VPREDRFAVDVGNQFVVDVGNQIATLVTVRWRTPPPSSIDERLVVTDDGHARLEVLKPRSFGDAVGTYEGAVEEAEVRELIAAGLVSCAGNAVHRSVVQVDASQGRRGRDTGYVDRGERSEAPLGRRRYVPDSWRGALEVELDGAVQDPRLAAVAAAADRLAQRLLASPRAVAQFFARPVGAVPPLPETLALGVLGTGSEPVEFELNLAECMVHFSSSETQVLTPLPELSVEFMTPDAEGLGGVRQRATIAPGIVGTVSMPLVVPEGADELSVHVVGRWFLPDEERAEDFEARTESQKL
jgi:hypothetical protein